MQLTDLEILYARLDKIRDKLRDEEEKMKSLPFTSYIENEYCAFGWYNKPKRLMFHNKELNLNRPILETRVEDRIIAYRMLPELHKQIDKDLREFLEKMKDI